VIAVIEFLAVVFERRLGIDADQTGNISLWECQAG
jgi:hypothetical protein